MKTKEFIQKVEELGYLIKDCYVYWQIRNKENSVVAIVDKNVLFKFSTDFNDWDYILDDDKDKLLSLIVEFARTSSEDREEEKRYYLKHRWLTEGGFYKFVKHHTKAYGEKYELASWTYGDTSDMQYTLKEIEEIKEKFDTDLSDFELIEVEE